MPPRPSHAGMEFMRDYCGYGKLPTCRMSGHGDGREMNYGDWLYDEYSWDVYEETCDEPTQPLFGCACENPLTVDWVCRECREYLRRQDMEAQGGPRWWLVVVVEALWSRWWRVRIAVGQWRQRRRWKRIEENETPW